MQESSHNRMYALTREGFDDPFHIEYYLDETIAKNRMIEFAIKTRCEVCVYVYELNIETPERKMNLISMINLAKDDSKRFCRIWLKQDGKELPTDFILKHPDIMYDCLDYIDCTCLTR